MRIMRGRIHVSKPEATMDFSITTSDNKGMQSTSGAPRILADWTKERLIELLDNKCFEPESFDFKEFRVGKKTEPEKRDIRKDCCAFANSAGGFLVYGVGDDKRLPAKDRL